MLCPGSQVAAVSTAVESTRGGGGLGVAGVGGGGRGFYLGGGGAPPNSPVCGLGVIQQFASSLPQ